MKIYEYADRFSLQFADAVVLVNKEMLQHPYFKRKHLRHIHIIDNGITANPSYHAPFRKDIYDFCKDHNVIGAIGRLSEEKGFRYLIEAFGKISKYLHNVRLLILGEGPQRSLLQQLEAQMVEPNLVYMPGFVEEASRYLTLFDVLVIPSLTEGLPLTLLEALRDEVPVIASSVGGIPDVLDNGKYGILVSACDTEELASAIAQALISVKRNNQLQNNGRKHFLNKYTSANMCKNYLKLYDDILTCNSSCDSF